MGPYKGLKTLRRIVEDCIKNIHPIYHIKTLMIKRELAKDPALANENWDRWVGWFWKEMIRLSNCIISTVVLILNCSMLDGCNSIDSAACQQTLERCPACQSQVPS